MKISDLVIVTATGDCVETCCPWEIGSGDTFVTYDFTRLRLFFENEPDGHFQGVALEPETKQTRGALWSEENQNPPPSTNDPCLASGGGHVCSGKLFHLLRCFCKFQHCPSSLGGCWNSMLLKHASFPQGHM